MLRQLRPDAPVAEAGLAGMDPRFGKALGRRGTGLASSRRAARLDLCMAAIAFIAGVTLAVRFALSPAGASPGGPGRGPRPRRRSSLPRSSSRLWSRCASSCSARPSATAGARTTHGEPPRPDQSLTTLQLGRRFPPRRRSSGCPAPAHLVLDLDRQRRGSLAGTRARCRGPGRSSRRCRRTRRRTSPARLGVTPMSMISPSRLMPSPYRMSNSAVLNGGATLFFTTLTLVSLPMASSPFLMVPMRRMSSRTEA